MSFILAGNKAGFQGVNFPPQPGEVSNLESHHGLKIKKHQNQQHLTIISGRPEAKVGQRKSTRRNGPITKMML